MSKKSKTATKSKSAKKAKGPAKRTRRGAWSAATNARTPVKERTEALAEVSWAVCEKDENLQKVLKILRNKDEAAEVRLAALQTLQAASFSVIAFESCRSDYVAALREIATDQNLEIRQRALGILSREKDGFAQKKLLEGLENPEKAIVPPEKALQFLSYDIHAEAYPLAREIVSNPPNADAKREALRLLAADATSVPLFEKVLQDKDEMAENRQIAASALQALKPEKLQDRAREILLDKGEYDDIQATSLTALTQFGNDEEVAGDKALLKRIDDLSDAKSTKLKQSARRFMTRYGK